MQMNTQKIERILIQARMMTNPPIRSILEAALWQCTGGNHVWTVHPYR